SSSAAAAAALLVSPRMAGAGAACARAAAAPAVVVDRGARVSPAQTPQRCAADRRGAAGAAQFTSRSPDSLHVLEQGTDRRYELLDILEFNSDRKRMSVIVRFPDGSIRLL